MSEGAGDGKGRVTGVEPGALSALLQEVAATPEVMGAEPLTLPPGTVVGRFEIVRELGRGGFGVVYEAMDRDLGRQVAVKLVRPGRVREEEGKVSREAEAIARLSHPNLITLFEVGRGEHGPFLVFELLRGKTLDLKIEKGPLPVQEAVHIATEVARGLAHAHAEGVIHRDLKPANVFVTNKGQVKVLDFGMAHAFGRRRIYGGTPAYMAPEQWDDAPEDERTDVFALGVMLYRMLTGEYPFPEGQGRWSAEPAIVRKLEVPGASDLAEVVEKMLDPIPTRRPRDGAAVLAALTPIEDRLRAKPADGKLPEHAKQRKATFGDLLAELKRRHVFRVMIGYGIFAFAVLQVTEPIMHGADLPNWVLKAVLIALVLGFPVAMILAWVYDLTAQGVKRTPSFTDPRAPRFGGFRPLPPLAVAAAVLAIATVGAGGWNAWKRVVEHRPAVAAPGTAPSIAVLPFADMSPKHDQEYFADGIAEEIRNALAHVDGLKVIGRTSSSSFKGKPDDLKAIGQKLGVVNVLEGSLRMDGNGIRVTAQLTRVADGTHLWSESYDRNLSGIFKVQEEIAKAVVSALKVKLLPDEAAALERSKTTPDAYLQYLLGYQHFIRGHEGDIAMSVAAYERALALDPGYSPAWAGLAWSLDFLAEDEPGLDRLLSMKRRANEAADRAVALGPTEGRAYYARGGLRATNRHEWAAGLADLEKAITLDGGDSAVYRVHGYILAALGRLPEAITSLRRATDLEPLAAWGWLILGRIYNGSGQFDQARSAFQKVLEIAPDHSTIRCRQGDVLLLEGRPAEALAAAEACRAEMWRLTLTAMAEHSLGREMESSRALRTLIERNSISAAYQIAEVSAWRGENDKAFEWLSRADAQMDGGLADLKYSPFLRSLHADPRWGAFLKKLNLPVD